MACVATSEGSNPNSVLSQIALGVNFDPDDDFIAVMGVTGSGKSTFISRLIGGGATVGDDLVSCTREVESFTFHHNARTIHLIDTPGFDDTYRTDSDVLKDIAYWLDAAYTKNIRLSGIVYLHPINQNRVCGSVYKNLRMFQRLCGDASLHSVVLATTMWKLVDEQDGERRQEQLKDHSDFFGDMLSQGSYVFRHDDDRASAIKIINYLLGQRNKTVLQIQREIADGMTLDETSAGQELEKELIKQREKFEQRLKEAQEDMKQALDEGNRRAIEAAAQQQESLKKRLDEAQKGSDDIKVSMQKLLEEKEVEYAKTLKKLEADQERAVNESKEALRQMEAMKQKMRENEEDATGQLRRYRSDLDDAMRFTEQQLEREISLQNRLAEESKLPPSYESATTSSDESFKKNFGKSAGKSLGDAAGNVLAGGLFVASALANNSNCSVM